MYFYPKVCKSLYPSQLLFKLPLGLALGSNRPTIHRTIRMFTMIKLSAIISSLVLTSSVFATVNNNTLAKLTDLAGASGFEQSVRNAVKQQWQQSMQEVNVDGIGNLIGQFKNDLTGPNVLLMAHMDEIGYMVESITPEGFLKIIPLGGIPPAVIYAQRWTVSTPKGPVLAYSGMDSIHIIDEKKKHKIPEGNAIFLDIGAESKEQAYRLHLLANLAS